MSRVLFVCSGNTCRSPMAAALAARVFGPSHTVMSGGAETGSGGRAAPNAIAVMSELGVDISNHRTVDVADLNLATFDLLVLFWPSAAERLPIPEGVPVAYLDVADPYLGSLDAYRTAARLIERGVRRLYVEDALRRASFGDVQKSSHLSGLFNRAAKECEKEVAGFVLRDLEQVVPNKATLGHLAASISECAALSARPDLAQLSAAVAAVNDVWVKVKHRVDPPVGDLLQGITAIRRVFELLEQWIAGRS